MLTPAFLAPDTEDIPRVSVNRTRYDVNRGDNVTLPCDYDASPEAKSVQWLRRGVPLSLPSPDGRVVGGKVNRSALTISDLHIADADSYECQVTNAIGTGSSGGIDLGVVCKYWPFFPLFCLVGWWVSGWWIGWWVVGWLVGGLAGGWVGGLVGWWVGGLVGWLVYWWVGGLVGWMVGGWVDWLIGGWVDLLVGGLVGWWIGWWIGWLVDWLVGGLVGGWIGWWVGWLFFVV